MSDGGFLIIRKDGSVDAIRVSPAEELTYAKLLLNLAAQLIAAFEERGKPQEGEAEEADSASGTDC